ncbi:Werner Syndrome-like exonuclease [Abrus precatorius]|uniref:Werner Syndrome-like exonuclease n=1 Tax=Abrus precatorius TaxID=3816 RepID=A0A8B8M7W1_ABRPR|nr:Werner Syndrome-like exonuclease [Abrus precatorius]
MPTTVAHRRYSRGLPIVTHEEFDIDMGNGKIVTCTLTNSAAAVDMWIFQTCRVREDVVGLDVEWRPFGENNPVATLQLCVRRRCLVFQLLHSSHIPFSLLEFLRDPSLTFVGVGVYDDGVKLLNDYGLEVYRTVDLGKLAMSKLRLTHYPGLKFLALQVLSVDIVKPKNVTLSRWDNRWLTPAQVQYASVDAIASYEIGKTLRAWEVQSDA